MTRWLRTSGAFDQRRQLTLATMSALTSKHVALWAEVSAMLGPRASELTFLRSRALGASALSDHS